MYLSKLCVPLMVSGLISYVMSSAANLTPFTFPLSVDGEGVRG
jgi:hypothetical protein